MERCFTAEYFSICLSACLGFSLSCVQMICDSQIHQWVHSPHNGNDVVFLRLSFVSKKNVTCVQSHHWSFWASHVYSTWIKVTSLDLQRSFLTLLLQSLSTGDAKDWTHDSLFCWGCSSPELEESRTYLNSSGHRHRWVTSWLSITVLLKNAHTASFSTF